jgi:hypothetical protein
MAGSPDQEGTGFPGVTREEKTTAGTIVYFQQSIGQVIKAAGVPASSPQSPHLPKRQEKVMSGAEIIEKISVNDAPKGDGSYTYSDDTDASDFSGEQVQHPELENPPRNVQHPKLENPPRSPHGMGECEMCHKSFPKSAHNSKVCFNVHCKAAKLLQRKDQKKKAAARSSAAKKKAKEASEAAEEEASALLDAKKRKLTTAGLASPGSAKRSTGGDSTGLFQHRAKRSPTGEPKEAPAGPKKSPDGVPLLVGEKPDGNEGNGDRVYAKVASQTFWEPRSAKDQMEEMLDWRKVARTILRQGFQIINLQWDPNASMMNVHCELMWRTEGPAWHLRRLQGWEDGSKLILDAILEDAHKIENLPPFHNLINVARSVMHTMAAMMHKVNKGQARPTQGTGPPGVTVKKRLDIEVSYVIHESGEHKGEFVHAESMIQADLMAIMPLDNDSTPIKSYPYQSMGAGKQGPIDRHNPESGWKEVMARFRPLGNTRNGAEMFYDDLECIPKIGRGELLLFNGDWLYARPAGNRKKPERYLCFKGKWGAGTTPKGAESAKEGPHDTAAQEATAAPSGKQPDSPLMGNSKQDATEEGGKGDVTGASPSAAAPQLLEDRKQGAVGKGGQPDAPGDSPSTAASPPVVESEQVATEASGKGDVPGASPGLDGPPVAAGGKQATSEASNTAPEADFCGVVDAVVLWRYNKNEWKEWRWSAAIHNLIAAGYVTGDEAVRFYTLRYPHEDEAGTKRFKERFIEEFDRNKSKTDLFQDTFPMDFSF